MSSPWVCVSTQAMPMADRLPAWDRARVRAELEPEAVEHDDQAAGAELGVVPSEASSADHREEQAVRASWKRAKAARRSTSVRDSAQSARYAPMLSSASASGER